MNVLDEDSERGTSSELEREAFLFHEFNFS